MLTKLSLLLFIFSIFTVASKAQDFVGSVRVSLDRGAIQEAEAKLMEYHKVRGATPEYILAYSWLGRNALALKQYPRAEEMADKTYAMAKEQLKHRPLDAEPQLPTALGAAIEVKAQALAAEGERNDAVEYLRGELAKYSQTSIATRIQKNLNLLSLGGKTAPALHEARYLGPKPEPLAAYRGKPVILFFWAHWCADCKAQVPILARLKQEFGDKLALVGPTQLYGYAAEGRDATPQQELQHIDAVRKKYLARLADMPVPVSKEDFRQYGVSTTPTLVLLGADGKVKLYHPGRMTYEELKSQLEKVLFVTSDQSHLLP